MTDRDEPPRPIRFSLRTTLIVVGAICLLLGAVSLFSKHSEKLARTKFAQRNIVPRLELLDEHFRLRESDAPWSEMTGDHWPISTPVDARGKPINSWRFQLTPWTYGLDETWPSPDDLAAAWDAPRNHRWRTDQTEGLFTHHRTSPSVTVLFGVTGPDTAFDSRAISKYLDLPPNTIVLIEVADAKTHWMQPGDYNVTDLLAYRGKIGDHLHGLLPDRLHVLFADGEVWALSPDAPMSALHPFLTITGAKSHDRDQLLAPHRVDAPE